MKLRGPIWGPSETRLGLYHHRTKDVRLEQRASLLAYGFMRGRSYAALEGSAKSAPPFNRAAAIAEKFSAEDKRVTRQRFAEWLDAAKGGDAR